MTGPATERLLRLTRREPSVARLLRLTFSDPSNFTQGSDGRLTGSVAEASRTPAARAAKTDRVIKEAGGMNGAHSTQNIYDNLNGVKGKYTAAREAQQAEIIDKYMKQYPNIPDDHEAIIAGGLGGSGKTSTLTNPAMAAALGADTANYLPVNPDNIKEMMASSGMYDQVGDLSPMEHAAFMHEESSDISAQIADAATAKGTNVMYDITGHSPDSYQSRLDDLTADGYKTKGVFVDVPVDTSISRAADRYERGAAAYDAGSGLGGRYVPPGLQMAQADPTGQATSLNMAAFNAMKSQFTDGWVVFDNSGSKADGPKVVAAG